MGDNAGDSVVVELVELRGCMQTSFARVEGQLTVISDRVARAQEDINTQSVRVQALEERRWPLTSVGVLAGAVSAIVAAVPWLVK